MVSNVRLIGREKYAALRTLAATLNSVSDLDVVMEAILTEARRFVAAEAGSIYTIEGGKLIFAYSQNDATDKMPLTNEARGVKNLEIPLVGNSLASYAARENVALNIADAYNIPLEAPYRFDPEFDRKTGYLTRSILTLPLNDNRRRTIGVLQVINRKGENGKVEAFDGEDEELMRIFSSTAAMSLERAQLVRLMLLRSVKMAALHDPRETVAHARRVAALAVMLYERWARRRPLDRAEVKRNLDHLRMAAMLHDVGKVGIPGDLLNKPGRLDAHERQEMEKHVLIGLRLFEPVSSGLDAMIREVILNHHERWDGQGYPGWINTETGLPLPGRHDRNNLPVGKKGEEISIFGRVTAVADVFDALISPKVYKESFDEDLVSQIMLQESGHHFDPELVDILIDNLDQARKIRNRFPEV